MNQINICEFKEYEKLGIQSRNRFSILSNKDLFQNFDQKATKNSSEEVRLLETQFGSNTLTALKFMFSKKGTKIDEIFTVDLTLCGKCPIDGEDFVNFCGLFRKHEL